MRKQYIILPVFLILVLSGSFFIFVEKDEVKKEATTTYAEETKGIQVEQNYDIKTHIVSENETFADIMQNEFAINYNQMLDILEVASSTYDLTKIKVGQPLRLAKDESNKNIYLEYELGKESYIHIDFLLDNNFKIEKKSISYDTKVIKQSASINNSMYLDGLAQNIPEGVIIEFADIFAWTIDFSVQVQKDDKFEILYEQRFRDGKEAGYGRILAGKFVNSGKIFTAYLFEDAEGKATYYSAEGENLQKQFLKAPLEFKRITSGYTYARFDPINYTKQKHLAIDYAAPIGTPVMSVGDGTVEFVGWNNQGFGNFISIHHNDTYTTQYAHLSGFAKGLKKGDQVVQGEVIGYVGSTGHSTGPHLHYQIKENGALVNPMNLDLPAGDPVPEEKRSEFKKIVAEYNDLMK
ncbi:MAG: peptidoglycan DD-metalloendopeptidase family protein [Candidatus Magasanikbacteria bacterium]